jgi:hypothetical protein
MFIVLQINKLTSGAISNLRKLRLYGEVKKKPQNNNKYHYIDHP